MKYCHGCLQTRYYKVGKGPFWEISKGRITPNSQRNNKLFLWDLFSLNFRKRPRKSTYFFGAVRLWLRPWKPPPFLGRRQKRYLLVLFRLLPRKGGGFHGRSQSLTEPEKLCRFPRPFLKIQTEQIPQKQFFVSSWIWRYVALSNFSEWALTYLIIARLQTTMHLLPSIRMWCWSSSTQVRWSHCWGRFISRLSYSVRSSSRCALSGDCLWRLEDCHGNSSETFNVNLEKSYHLSGNF